MKDLFMLWPLNVTDDSAVWQIHGIVHIKLIELQVRACMCEISAADAKSPCGNVCYILWLMFPFNPSLLVNCTRLNTSLMSNSVDKFCLVAYFFLPVHWRNVLQLEGKENNGLLFIIGVMSSLVKSWLLFFFFFNLLSTTPASFHLHNYPVQ